MFTEVAVYGFSKCGCHMCSVLCKSVGEVDINVFFQWCTDYLAN